MASDPATVAFAVRQMQGAGLLRHARMFGEYGIWCDGKLVALVCDDQLFLKPTAGAMALMADLPTGPPYAGARPMVIGDALLDDPDRLARVVAQIAADLPELKPKKPRKT